ncbi:MAG: TetR/AcrR family transcriptional regulator [Eggerthellaceae bacterium]|nr:TetR/AcrR family transcriptional regulator [Eggerthellaceae bacterium]
MVLENMRVLVTKRMLREGLFRCLEHTSIDKVSVSELCRESGINRATFYNHYDTPKDILVELGWEAAKELKTLFAGRLVISQRDMVVQCLTLLRKNKREVKAIVAASADESLVSSALEMFRWLLGDGNDLRERFNLKDEVEYDLTVRCFGSMAYNLIRRWIVEDVDKTPEEIADLFIRLAGM